MVTTSGHRQDMGVVLFQCPWPFPHTAEASHGHNPGAAAISDPLQDSMSCLVPRPILSGTKGWFSFSKRLSSTPGITQNQAGAAFPLPGSPLPSCLPPSAHHPGTHLRCFFAKKLFQRLGLCLPNINIGSPPFFCAAPPFIIFLNPCSTFICER